MTGTYRVQVVQVLECLSVGPDILPPQWVSQQRSQPGHDGCVGGHNVDPLQGIQETLDIATLRDEALGLSIYKMTPNVTQEVSITSQGQGI